MGNRDQINDLQTQTYNAETISNDQTRDSGHRQGVPHIVI